ncbi:hypothetical protein KEM55_000158 [Ascosphaera atra]|nr:hypothetical protein KEM55_000158 [Ascosphaera atra]
MLLLTGRSEAGFADIIKRIVKSRDLSFDIICLKPEVDPWGQQFGSTMKFKQAFLDDLLHTYKEADEMRIYEDRPRQ